MAHKLVLFICVTHINGWSFETKQNWLSMGERDWRHNRKQQSWDYLVSNLLFHILQALAESKHFTLNYVNLNVKCDVTGG